jgi:hypothetical protein
MVKKFADLGISRLARICNLRVNKKCVDLRTGTPKKFADLRKRNEPKNLLICDLWIKKKICVSIFVTICKVTKVTKQGRF